MNIDLDAIKQTLAALGAIITLLKQAKDLLPDNAKRQEISQAIDNAEQDLIKAELNTAKALGHEICYNHWPSGIMLSKDRKHWKCPVCSNEIKPEQPKQSKHPFQDVKGL
jgi:hypothetical protein